MHWSPLSVTIYRTSQGSSIKLDPYDTTVMLFTCEGQDECDSWIKRMSTNCELALFLCFHCCNSFSDFLFHKLCLEKLNMNITFFMFIYVQTPKKSSFMPTYHYMVNLSNCVCLVLLNWHQCAKHIFLFLILF